jgi:hypothetical protein
MFFRAIIGAGGQFRQSRGLVFSSPQSLEHDFYASIVTDDEKRYTPLKSAISGAACGEGQQPE